MSTRTRRRAACSPRSGPTRAFNQNFLTFNSLNSYILKGDAAQGMELTFASLMARAEDEPDAMYGLAARAVRISADGLTYRFLLRPGITLPRRQRAHRARRRLLAEHAEGEGPPDHHSSCCAISPARRRATTRPWWCALRRSARATCRCSSPSLPIFSRAYYCQPSVRRDDARDAARLRPLQGRTLRGRALHRIRAGQGLVGRRSAGLARAATISTWCATNIYRDRDVAFEGFTGKSYLFREEFTSRIWATRYDFPGDRGRPRQARRHARRHAVGRAGLVHQHAAREVQGQARCARRLIYAFDFEWTNKTIMYGSYERTHSVFQNSDMMAKGKPGADELALLEPFRGKVPDEVFGEPFVPPVSDGSGQDRALLRKASAAAAGGRLRDQGRQARDAEGRADHDRIPDRRAVVPAASHAVHQESRHARHRGDACASSIRCSTASASDDFDFDLTVQRFGFSSTPGRFAAHLFLLAGRRAEGLAESRRHRRPGRSTR